MSHKNIGQTQNQTFVIFYILLWGFDINVAEFIPPWRAWGGVGGSVTFVPRPYGLGYEHNALRAQELLEIASLYPQA